mmetsp:Transcript_44832/g.117615  ORF Transcript_44832/g.117615 Transcript_44832/m.117615 type:complete len:107 (+) Transcript_44832:406-726(+)
MSAPLHEGLFLLRMVMETAAAIAELAAAAAALAAVAPPAAAIAAKAAAVRVWHALCRTGNANEDGVRLQWNLVLVVKMHISLAPRRGHSMSIAAGCPSFAMRDNVS